MKTRDRVVELRRVKASELRRNPKNWRTHPAGQRDALRGVLDDVGYADALLARQLDDGQLELIDGHLRAETTPDDVVPVLILDVSDAESDKLLAVLDPLVSLAGTSESALDQLLEGIATENHDLRGFLDRVANEYLDSDSDTDDADTDLKIPEMYQVVVDCDDESAQRVLYERLVEEGHRCRVLTL